MPAETKIAATHRLQKDGRWDQACRFRERHREALRAQGLTRKESRERSWQLMIERFEPVDQDWLQWQMIRARFPPLVVPGDMLWDFCCAWSAACQLLGYLGSQAADLRPVEAMSTATKARLDSIPNNSEVHLADQTTLQVLLSHPEPGAHLGDIEDQLRTVMGHVDQSRPGGPEALAEISQIVDLIPEMKKAVETFWPLEIEPEAAA